MIPNTISTGQRDWVLYGSSGRIGSALVRASAGVRLHRAWDVGLIGGCPCDIIFACGMTDPGRPAEEIRAANFDLPVRVIEEVESRGLTDVRFLTLGTVMETVVGGNPNPYIASKIALANSMRSRAMADGGRGRFLHVRLHTVYGGGPPAAHMFLGQMACALADGVPFKMSSGEQLREYHQVDDAAGILRALLLREWSFGNEIEISSGSPVRLVDIARAVFRACGKESLLRVGSLPLPGGENLSRVFERAPSWIPVSTGDPIAGIVGEFMGAAR